ncbi:MAG TPA: oligopeptide transporter, OPT family [Thermoplasmata archaeon]|nr:oligopeptide transporter, OPT family [Thermoplasmata archaeon]
MIEKDFVPYIPPEEENVPEFTVKAVLLGMILAFTMAAANAYLGLKAGMTVSAAIPAAVISMAVFTGMYRANLTKNKATVLETNLSKTCAAAGEALAAGVVFTIPALLVLGLWDDVEIFPTMGIALVGGLLGVIFTIPLRRVLIIDMDLPFPEGVACTEVILAGEEGGRGGSYVFKALGIGALWQVARDANGFRLFSSHFDTTFGKGKVRFWIGSELSAALMGVGYIIGPRISMLVVMGGALGWLVIIPLIGFLGEIGVYGDGWTAGGTEGFLYIWANYLRYVGVGAMVVGSIYTLITMRKALSKSLAPVFKRKEKGIVEAEPIRTEHDLNLGLMFGFAGVLIIPMILIYYHFSDNASLSVVSALMMIVAAFVFSSIAGYIAGILGSSSNPISGVTIATLSLTSVLFMYLFHLKGNEGMLTAVGVAAVICVAAAIGGDVLQELKTGQLLGSTPRVLQLGEFIGVTVAALTIPFVVLMLHESSGIGTRELPAPQAYVMAAIVDGIFKETMKWEMVFLGGFIACGLIAWNYYVEMIIKQPERKVSVMGVAVGVYLPFTTSFCIAIGGFLKYLTDRFIETDLRLYQKLESEEEREKAITSAKEKVGGDGFLVASGLIAGEALMGVALASFVFLNIEAYKFILIAKEIPGKWHGLIAFFYLMALVYYFGLRSFLKKKEWGEIFATLKEVAKEDSNRLVRGIKGKLGFR